MRKLGFFFNPVQDGDEAEKGGGGGPPYQFFPCNFYKLQNYTPKLSDIDL